MFYIYILFSESADKYYVGYTDDPDRRVIEHNTSPHNTFTAKYRPWKLVASFLVGTTRGEAVRVERFIKKQKSRKLILDLIQHQDDPEFLVHRFESRMERTEDETLTSSNG